MLARIDEALASVENPDVLTAILIQTGAFHKKIPGFNPDMFWVRVYYLSFCFVFSLLITEYHFLSIQHSQILY